MPPRPQIPLLATVLVLTSALLVSACGSSAPENGIPSSEADGLVAALENLQADVGNGDCEGASAKLVSIRADIDALQGVNAEIRNGLTKLADRLEALLADCAPETTTPDTTSTSSEESTSSEAETSTETTTETDSTSSDTEPTEPPQDTEPTEPGNGSGNGNGNGPPSDTPGNGQPDNGGFEPGGTGGLPPGQEGRR